MRCAIVIAIMIAKNLPQSRRSRAKRLISLVVTMSAAFKPATRATNKCPQHQPPMLLVYFIMVVILCDQHTGAAQAAIRGAHRPKFRIIEADALTPPEQRLALQIMILENTTRGPKLPGANTTSTVGDKSSDENELAPTTVKRSQHAPGFLRSKPGSRPGGGAKLNLKRPYDFGLENVGFHNGDLSAQSDERTQFLNSLADEASDPNQEQQAATRTTTQVPLVTVSMNQRSELIRTQHRPPWFKQQQQQQQQQQAASDQKSKNKQQLLIKLANAARQQQHKFKLASMATTLAPAVTTTEFFRLISSAHSPVKIEKIHRLKFGPIFAHKVGQFVPNELTESPGANADRTSYYSGEDRPATTTTTTTTVRPTVDISTATPTTSRAPLSSRSAANSTKSDSRVVMAPELLVTDDEDDADKLDDSNRDANELGNSIATADNKLQLGPRRHLVNYTIKSPTLKKPVTIVRHSASHRRRQHAQRTTSSSTTEAPSYLVIPHHIRLETTSRPPVARTPFLQPPPERVIVSSGGGGGGAYDATPTPAPANLASSSSLTPPPAPQLVRLIAKQKHKYDDNITSPPLTVIDNDAFRLPPNTTAVHGNRLIVRIKPGKGPSPARFQVTTEYPYYNPVAGITPPYPSHPTTTRAPYTNGGGRPTSASNYTAPVPGQPHYGYVRPGPGDPGGNPPSLNTTGGSSGGTFGAQNIRFPAPAPTSLIADHSAEPPQPPPPPPVDRPAPIPERLNVSVPSDASLVGPNRVPDRLVVETGESNDRPDVSAISDATIVARPPYGTQVHVTQEGIIRLSTTRKPARYSTTKRINIVSANTTVITANPDQLHEVLSSIEGSHHAQHHRPVGQGTGRPGILASIGKIFNASVATTAIALMTLIKTILIAVLVMFLPPIALTAAIVQAVSLG